MAFVTDQQTLDDLNIFGRHGSDSVYQIFNRTLTRGGTLLLEEYFRNPLSDEQSINKRIGIIRYFADSGTIFPFISSDFDLITPYLSSQDERTRLSAQSQTIAGKLSKLVAVDAESQMIHNGIIALAGLLKQVDTFIQEIKLAEQHPYQSEKDAVVHLLSESVFSTALSRPLRNKWTDAELAEYDAVFRFRHRDLILKLLRYIYDLDVYLTVAKVAVERGFSFPEVSSSQEGIQIAGLYHPQVTKAVPNSIEITPQSSVIFLTGANMAGKSTFMKSLSIAVYLAHMGFPVPASSMQFSVLDGIYSTINLPDDLGIGASHFYAEVLRAKKIATELRNKQLFVVFDELFRGTNVKDACEATIAFTKAFAEKGDSIFVISTHIIEAADVLKEACENINFVYLPTLMKDNQPLYTYQLQQGITTDRHGMIIVQNEGILDVLEEGLGKHAVQTHGSFITDKQSLADLNLLGKYKSNSIYSLFNKVQSPGGERLLQEMFQHPLKDPEKINFRSGHFSYFQQQQQRFPFEKETLIKAEEYLSMDAPGNYAAAISTIALKKLQGKVLRDDAYEVILSGLLVSITVLNQLKDFLGQLQDASTCIYAAERKRLLEIFADRRLQWLSEAKQNTVLSLVQAARYDYLLRHTLRPEMDEILEGIYHLDVYIAVAGVAKARGLDFATALPMGSGKLSSTAIWHPALLKGIANSVSLHQDQHMIFLTGANMAGKSTFMKAFGIAIYLAHMGFPVAGRNMQFSVMDGLYSSINVPDDLNMGYSHFYAEVLRVKKVAEEVSAGKNLVVLFDELFKGTNVKDAYDATLAVTGTFSKYNNCFFIISTHIIEVGDALRERNSNIRLAYLPTEMEGNIPRYTYRLKEGITSDRQGMMIIENEGILEIIKSKK